MIFLVDYGMGVVYFFCGLVMVGMFPKLWERYTLKNDNETTLYFLRIEDHGDGSYVYFLQNENQVSSKLAKVC